MYLFQSLIGILVNCNLSDIPKCSVPYAVSIPNRDFGELQYFVPALLLIEAVVSIPNRDFGELQFAGSTANSARYPRFNP